VAKVAKYIKAKPVSKGLLLSKEEISSSDFVIFSSLAWKKEASRINQEKSVVIIKSL